MAEIVNLNRSIVILVETTLTLDSHRFAELEVYRLPFYPRLDLRIFFRKFVSPLRLTAVVALKKNLSSTQFWGQYART